MITSSMFLRDLAMRGAPARLQEIQTELNKLFHHFPELFPHGEPRIVDEPEASIPYKTRVDKADKLIRAAERMAKGAGVKLGRPQNSKGKGWKRQAPQKLDNTYDVSGNFLLVAEAAKMLGVTASTVSNLLNDGQLKAATKEQYQHHRGWTMIPTEDIIKVGVSKGWITPAHQLEEQPA